MSAGAARGLARAIVPGFEAATGVTVAGTFGAVGAMRERIAGGADCDVVILTTAAIDALAQSGVVAPGSRAPLGRVRTGVAVRSGDAHPAVHDAASLVAALAAADAIFFPDPDRATAGIHFISVLERLGLRERVQHALRPHENGAAAMTAMAAAAERAVLGCTQVTEILYTPGVALVAPLPVGFELAAAYEAAVMQASRVPELAARLVMALGGPRSAAVRRAGGFQG